MSIKAPERTHNYHDLERYFKYNMSSGLIMSTIERKVMDEMENFKGNNFGTFIKFFSIGLMIFMIMIGTVVLLRSLPNTVAVPSVIPTIQGMMFLMWRGKHGKN